MEPSLERRSVTAEGLFSNLTALIMGRMARALNFKPAAGMLLEDLFQAHSAASEPCSFNC